MSLLRPQSIRRRNAMVLCALFLGMILFAMAPSSSGINRFHGEDLDSDSSFSINGSVFTIEQIANSFAPSIIVPDDLDFPPIEIKYYAHQFEDDELTISYRVVRENERHPSKFIHPIYAFYRSIRYGSVFDIEYIDIVINMSDGKVDSFRFERPDSESGSIQHVPMHYIIDQDSGNYIPAEVEGNVEPLSLEWGDFGFLIASWNGLFEIEELDNDEIGRETAVLPVSQANQEFTSKYKMWKRSSGYL